LESVTIATVVDVNPAASEYTVSTPSGRRHTYPLSESEDVEVLRFGDQVFCEYPPRVL
jgi:hypothetical protein